MVLEAKHLSGVKIIYNKRLQTVLANNIKSGTREIICGVPQGSVLGPQFFMLSVTDMQMAVGGRNDLQLYADDTVIHCRGKNSRVVQEQLQAKICRFSKWCRENKLTLNPSKTKLMVFGTREGVK